MNQVENFKKLVKGNNIASIEAALRIVSPNVKNTLMNEYKVSTIQELAFKLR